jgi:hypothetical protein
LVESQFVSAWIVIPGAPLAGDDTEHIYRTGRRPAYAILHIAFSTAGSEPDRYFEVASEPAKKMVEATTRKAPRRGLSRYSVTGVETKLGAAPS